MNKRKTKNDYRRSSVIRYTLLAYLVYHIPVAVAYLAIYYKLADYSYSDIHLVYASIVMATILSLITIYFKKKITARFSVFMLYLQIFLWSLIVTYKFYVMGDLRILTLIASFLALMFLFIQTRLIISFVIIAIVMSDYILISYIGVYLKNQPGSFIQEVLITLVFIPVSLFVAYMCNIVRKQHKKIKTARDRLKSTFNELETTHANLESYHQKMLDSLYYAEMIQSSLLPGIDRLKSSYPESMIIWMPKDIVGGDIFFTYTTQSEMIIVLMDCTGHGVPGAFLTMITYSEIRKIIMDEMIYEPALILKQLNGSVKNVLHKNSDKTMIDDGLDAAVCKINYSTKTVSFSSSKISMFYVLDGKALVLKGDNHSIGYKDSNEHYDFSSHIINNCSGICFYLLTDGYTDQLGGKRRRRFGSKRFNELITRHHRKPFCDQRKLFIESLLEYKDSNDQVDDITVIGFRG